MVGFWIMSCCYKEKALYLLEQGHIFNLLFRIEGGEPIMSNCWGQTLNRDEESWETNEKNKYIHIFLSVRNV